MAEDQDVVGPLEVAERLGINPATFRSWVHRGQAPERRWQIGQVPAWDWDKDIVPWAKDQGVMP